LIKEFCKKCRLGDDEFVGLKFENGNPEVYFPRGFDISDNDEQARVDILNLFGVLRKFSNRREGKNVNNMDGENNLSFPVLSYQYVINDFLEHGYYIEKEVHYTEATKGKIDWKRTIQKQRPQISNGNVVYLNFIVKTNKINNNNLITKIHEYCVYESFLKLGWLYVTNGILPPKPTIQLNKKMFLNVLDEALSNTFNDNKQMLFKSMINIIEQTSENITDKTNISFGVNRFEYVWENMIDYIFGEENKDEYFPHAKWHILANKDYKTESSALEPDTIMCLNQRLYVLDAKYYKYGITNNPQHLPGSSSIQKQITYGEYIEEKFSYSQNQIYNAFVMPFKKKKKTDDNYKFVSVGKAEWKKYSEKTANYYYVLGVLLDTRYVIESYAKHSAKDILELSELIQNSLKDYRNRFKDE